MNIKKITIRQAKLKDLKALKIYLPSEIPGFINEVINEYNKKEADWILAFDGSLQVGHIRMRWGGTRNEYAKKFIQNTPNLEAFGVRKDYRLRGIGSKILAAAEAKVRTRGYQKVGLSVEIRNELALSFFTKRGYKKWGHGIYKVEWNEIGKDKKIRKKTTRNFYLTKTLN